MSQIKIIIPIVLMAFLMSSCTESVSVDLDDAPPRLTVDASIDWEKGTLGNQQVIRLSTSQPFFSETSSLPATGATISIRNDRSGEVVNFVDRSNGLYTTEEFKPIIGDSYTLVLEYQGERYEGKETLYPVSNINRINQSLSGGFEDDLIDISVFWDDPAEEENYYLTSFYRPAEETIDYVNISDEFTNGNEQEEIYEPEEDDEVGEESTGLVAGEQVDITLSSISRRYYNYLNVLFSSGGDGGDPFAPVPVQAKGNIVNISNEGNYPFGYFRLTEIVSQRYTISE